MRIPFATPHRALGQVTLLGLGAALLAGFSAYAVLLQPGAPDARGAGGDAIQAETLVLDTEALAAALCIGGSDAPARRLWALQHPKSRRGQMGHRRTPRQDPG